LIGCKQIYGHSFDRAARAENMIVPDALK